MKYYKFGRRPAKAPITGLLYAGGTHQSNPENWVMTLHMGIDEGGDRASRAQIEINRGEAEALMFALRTALERDFPTVDQEGNR